MELVEQNDFIMGIDLGQVKPFSARVINLRTRELVTRELEGSRETRYLNDKIRRLEKNRNDCLSKVGRYNYLIGIVNGQGVIDIVNKRVRLELELYYLRKKISVLKVRLGRLMARDVNYFVEKYGVSKVNLERLNFVEGTGGKWDFSQQQDCISQKLEAFGIISRRVSASHTSNQNPFNVEYELGRKSGRNVVFDRFKVDRDSLGGTNVACRSRVKGGKRIVLNWVNNMLFSNPEFARIS